MKYNKILCGILSACLVFGSLTGFAETDTSSGAGTGDGSSSSMITPSIPLTLSPEDMSIRFFDSEGAEVSKSNLVLEAEYTYEASRYGYLSKSETFTASEDGLTVNLSAVAAQKTYGKNSYNITKADTALHDTDIYERYTVAGLKVNPIVVGDYIYACTAEGLVKLDKTTGEVKAQSEAVITPAIETPTYGDGMIFIPVTTEDGEAVYAYDADTLKKLWQTTSVTNIISKTIYNEGKLYVPLSYEDTDKIAIYNTTDYEINNTDENKDYYEEISAKCQYDAALVDGELVFGDGTTVYNFGDAEDGNVTLAANVSSEIVYDAASNAIIFMTDDNKLNIYVSEENKKQADVEVAGAFTVYDGLVLISAVKEDNTYLYAIDIETGEKKAELEAPAFSQLIIGEDKLYAVAEAGIYAVTVEKEEIEVPKDTEEEASEENTGEENINEENTPEEEPAAETVITYTLLCEEVYVADENTVFTYMTFDGDGEFYITNADGDMYSLGEDALSEEREAALAKLKKKYTTFKSSDFSETNYTKIVNRYNQACENINNASSAAELEEALYNGIDKMMDVDCNAANKITVYFMADTTNLNGKVLVEPVKATVSKYTTAAEVIYKHVSNIVYEGSLTSRFDLTGIANSITTTDIPAAIKEIMGEASVREDADYLSNGDYSENSRWVYTVNGEMPDTDAGDYVLSNNDVVRLQFSLCEENEDIYSDGGKVGTSDLGISNKDVLIISMANFRAESNYSTLVKKTANKKIYENATEVLKRPFAKESAVKEAADDIDDIDSDDTGSGGGGSGSGSGSWNSGSSSGSSSSGSGNTYYGSVTSVTAPATSSNEVFTDVADSHWAKDYIYKLYNKSIITGRSDTEFAPEDNITRAECVTLLARMVNADLSTYAVQSKFNDVASDKWYNAYINWATDKGIVNGMSETEFWPDTTITREQLATIISNCISNGVLSTSAAVAEAQSFADEAEIADYAKQAVTLVQSYGIINGMGENMFMPKGNATRAQAAKILAYFI